MVSSWISGGLYRIPRHLDGTPKVSEVADNGS